MPTPAPEGAGEGDLEMATQIPAVAALQVLASLRRPAWLVVLLLALILGAMLLRR